MIMDVCMSVVVRMALCMLAMQAVGRCLTNMNMLMLMPVHGVCNGTLGEHS